MMVSSLATRNTDTTSTFRNTYYPEEKRNHGDDSRLLIIGKKKAANVNTAA